MVSEYFNGKELNKSINHDKVIAYGAAVYATKISDDTSAAPLDDPPPTTADAHPRSVLVAVIESDGKILENEPEPLLGCAMATVAFFPPN
ncbi:2240_t:CDS:2 [Funneliformis caledonium]|uniref:2240_t:CDS:1 n=1 Tax=Funneliformis caledonium TaxID=1117310 RepID=A0A9N8VY53_9GLOM|nr:2240_t:CDS:2 [Funneliformis caledonium]